MPHSDEYRAKAVECLLQANRTPEPETRDLFLMLAMAYARLAECADRNARADLVYETPSKWLTTQ